MRNASYSSRVVLFTWMLLQSVYPGAHLQGQRQAVECTKTKSAINLICPSNALIRVEVVMFGVQWGPGRPCANMCCEPKHHKNDCMFPLRGDHEYFINASQTCNEKPRCSLETREEYRRFACKDVNNTTLNRPNDHILVIYFCNAQVVQTSSSTTTTTITTPTNATLTTSRVTQVIPATWTLSDNTIRNIITFAVVGFLVVVIIVLSAILCAKKCKSRHRGSTKITGQLQHSGSNFYDQTTPSSPVYSTISSPDCKANTQLYLPMQGVSSLGVHLGDTYVQKEKSPDVYSLSYHDIPAPRPPLLKLQSRDSGNYLEPVKKFSTLGNTSTSHRLNHPGPPRAQVKLRCSTELLASRSSLGRPTPPIKPRPMSMQLLTPEIMAEYEEIPADTMPKRVHQTNARLRPQAPPPLALVLPMGPRPRPSHSSVSAYRGRCHSEDMLLATSAPGDKLRPVSESASAATRMLASAVSMEEDDMILVDNVLYVGID